MEHDFLSAHGRRIGTVVHGPSGSYLVETRNRAYRVEHLGRARHHAAWLHGEVGGWVTRSCAWFSGTTGRIAATACGSWASSTCGLAQGEDTPARLLAPAVTSSSVTRTLGEVSWHVGELRPVTPEVASRVPACEVRGFRERFRKRRKYGHLVAAGFPRRAAPRESPASRAGRLDSITDWPGEDAYIM